MNIKRFFSTNRILIAVGFGLLILNFAVIEAHAQADGGISIGPPKMELVIPAGTEKTVGMIVDYTRDFPEAKLPIARLVARLEDWTVMSDGDIKFAPAGTMVRSAAPWVTYTPAEFSMAPDKRQVIRFTISVPKETPPGDYYFACYVEGRDAPPPPKEGERQINVSFRYYMIAYVMVPGLTTDGTLAGLETKVLNGYPVVIPKMENKGNSRLRPKHSVEVRDARDQVLFTTPMSEALVVLGGKSWQKPYPVEVELPAGKYKLAYTVDFGDKKALQVGKTEFVITEDDVAARRKLADKTTEARHAAPKPGASTDASAKPAGKPAEIKPANKTEVESGKSKSNTLSPAGNQR
jgi:hypothetical protein